MIRILHIAPRFPPALDGVGEYAMRLGAELERGGRFQNEYLATSDSGSGNGAVRTLEARTEGELKRALVEIEADAVLLHYSGYGFHKRGAPSWLVEGLRAARVKGRFRLAIFFHELWASGKPWKTEFYFSAWQRKVVFALRDLADGLTTSTPIMARLLRKSATVAPIPSLLPPVNALAERAALPFRIVIFGLEHTRERTVLAHRALLERLVRAGKIRSVTLTGARASRESVDYRALVGVVPPEGIELLGDASGEAIGATFAEANLCLSFYPPHLVTKSTTAAAAFASGCPLVLPRAPVEQEEYSPKPPYWMCGGSEAEANALIEAARNGDLWERAGKALSWYQEQASWPVHAARVAAVLGV